MSNKGYPCDICGGPKNWDNRCMIRRRYEKDFENREFRESIAKLDSNYKTRFHLNCIGTQTCYDPNIVLEFSNIKDPLIKYYIAGKYTYHWIFGPQSAPEYIINTNYDVPIKIFVKSANNDDDEALYIADKVFCHYCFKTKNIANIGNCIDNQEIRNLIKYIPISN